MEIKYWSDYACPFCYIGATNLKEAIKELGIDVPVDMLAFELDPNNTQKGEVDIVDAMAEKYNVSKEQALANMENIHEMAKDAGLNFDYTKARPSNTLNAHRLTKLAQTKGLKEEAEKLLYSAYFDKHQVLEDPAVLMEVAKELGIAQEEVKQLLNSSEFENDVRVDEYNSALVGVRGVPFFVINEELAIPGAISKNQWKQILTQYMDQPQG